jgi:hypothetical protein
VQRGREKPRSGCRISGLEDERKGSVVFNRAVVAAAVLVAFCLAAGTASAGVDLIQRSTEQVSFVEGAGLSNDTCQYVPAGTVIQWSGPETSQSIQKTDASGVTTISVVSHASGKATDQDGNTYAFNYSNAFRVSNSVDDPATFTGVMTDSFSLAGPALHLSNGFIANLTTDFSTFAFDPINSRGDPIDFTDGSAHCDPL